MDKNLIGACGTYCGDCEWVESTGCKGCRSNAGQPFWGPCKIALCTIENEIHHCGLCDQVPCTKLKEAFNTPGHEDHGERLANLMNWAEGKYEFIKLGSFNKTKNK